MFTFPYFVGKANHQVLSMLKNAGIEFDRICSGHKVICVVNDKALYDALVDANAA